MWTAALFDNRTVVTLTDRLRRAYLAAKNELAVYRCVMQHPRTSRAARWILGLAVGYLLTPIDIIPDFVPVLGQLDDVLIVTALIVAAKRLIPPSVWAECREVVGPRHHPPTLP